MTAAQVLRELKSLGSAGYARVLKNHGVKEPVYGVKISELKRFLKGHRGDQTLAEELYASKIYDAQYLAGLMADPAQMSKSDLKRWFKTANSVTICGHAVSALAAESGHGWALAREWLKSKSAETVQTGWTTLSALVSVAMDDDLDLGALADLLEQVEQTIHQQPDRVRYAMNNFVIALGSFVQPLNQAALAAAERIGRVEVDMGETSCEAFYAPDYIRKVAARGAIGKKRKSARC